LQGKLQTGPQAFTASFSARASSTTLPAR
jgi:hypothetical protein